MTLVDKRGVPTSTDDRRALDRFEAAVDLLNGFYLDPLTVVDEALAESPDFVMGHCFRAAAYAIANEKSVEPELRRSVEAAEALGNRANERERGHIAALRAWLDGDLHRAAALYGKVLVDHPRDLLALQIAHQFDFFLGESQMLRDRVAQVLPAWDEGVPGFGYVLGMHAFGLEETNLYGRAEAAGRKAVELERRDPWAIHAVTHVLEMQGRQEEGIDWLAGRSGDWAPDNMFAYHNWWHLALFHLDLGDIDRVLKLYDQSIRPGPTSLAIEVVDSTSLLWRLHLRGVDVGDRWKAAADAWETVAGDGHYAFNDAHAMMAFVADGRDKAADRVIAALERRIERGGTNAAMTRDVGLPFSLALRAFGRGDYAETVERLMPVRTLANRFGGSHAQRDVVGLTLVEAALRDGQGRLARALAAERTDLKPTSPHNWTLTQRALTATGDLSGAEEARGRVSALRSSAGGCGSPALAG